MCINTKIHSSFVSSHSSEFIHSLPKGTSKQFALLVVFHSICVVDCSWTKIWYVNIFLVIYIKGCYKSVGLMIGLGFVEEITIDLLSSYDFWSH
jgi:hypothetical protein